MKKRLANIELLRLLAMMMVVSLHFLGKGNLLPGVEEQQLSLQGHVAWLLESLSIAAVNTYVLISGYFLVETGFRLKRIVSLLLQVLFYTLLIPVVCLLTGVITMQDITLYSLLRYLLPINMDHYWFVSAYVLMFLLSPVLNAGIHAISKKQLQVTICLLLIMQSVIKTVLPFRMELDDLGYGVFWFLIVYLIAAYIRLYGIAWFEKKSAGKCFLVFQECVLLIYILVMALRLLYEKTGKFEHVVAMPISYNHLLVLLAAISLFYTFRKMTFAENGMSKWICRLAPYSFGVYLLHEHIEIRYRWPIWLGADQCTNAGMLILYWVVAIIAVMAAGLAIDFLRSKLFALLAKLPLCEKISGYMSSIDAEMAAK